MFGSLNFTKICVGKYEWNYEYEFVRDTEIRICKRLPFFFNR